MKKSLSLIGLCLLSTSVFAQTAAWDFVDEQLTFKEDVAYTKDGAPVNGVVKSGMYDYYAVSNFINGKPSGVINFYMNNGSFVGSATVPEEGNIIKADSPSEEYKKMMASYTQDELLKEQTRKYAYMCYLKFKDMMFPEGGQAVQTLACEDIVPDYLKRGIGNLSAYRARRIKKGDKSLVVVDAPFIPSKYRSALLMQNGEDGIYAQMQRTGNFTFSFKEE